MTGEGRKREKKRGKGRCSLSFALGRQKRKTGAYDQRFSSRLNLKN